MYRIKRRLAILLSSICFLVFLTIYVIINYAAPDELRKPEQTKTFLSNLKVFHKDLRIAAEDDKNLVLRLEQIDSQSKEYEADSQETLDGHNEPRNCNNIWQTNKADIQMLNMYDNMSFLDIDGGVWKQGWDIKYDNLKYNDYHKLKVIVVPHSHNDPGWIKTFDDYYEKDTKHILSNALRHLKDNVDMKFIWAEISYFSRFFEDLGEGHKAQMRKLVQNNQLEFVTGGWVMPDEANSHWYSVLMQLTEGQAWLKKHFNVTPTSSWSIDPFGHSASLPYILKKTGFQNLLIQRTHYSVKKELALKKNLEFRWKQFWDQDGSTELFTHMMPFYSYDIPHTCGPDPKICCQFDFKRLHGFGLSCPWRAPPIAIDSNNVDQRAHLIVDQWKKKAELYRTNVVLIPLGDDFRYSQSMEWDVQRVNYEKLFDHINAERKYFTEARFGTLQEYFDLVRKERKTNKFPSLTGDFFTYADRVDNYWSGYYTSRPFHKRMDRILLHYIRSAEIISSWCKWGATGGFNDRLDHARKQLSLFQHHDGITGTAKTHVVEDYERRMLDAIKACQFVIQQAAYRLLTKPSIYNADHMFHYFYMDDSRWQKGDESRITIILGDEITSKYVVVHNSLPKWREEVVEFYVSRPFMSVKDAQGNPVEAQISLVWTWHRHSLSQTVSPQASTTKYRLLFKARVPPFGMTSYIVSLEPNGKRPSFTSYSSDLILTTTPMSLNVGDYPEVVKLTDHRETEIRSSGLKVTFTKEGFLKTITNAEEKIDMPVNIQFLKYGTRNRGDRSGAYLFLPNGTATPMVYTKQPTIILSKGLIESSVSVGLPFGTHKVVVRGHNLEIQNLIDITELIDSEVVMRISCNIHNKDVFYTDLNGLQMIKRKRFSKLPLQANYYPIPSAIYIEDESHRLTLLAGQPLGGSSLSEGEIEVMQDRRLSYDDERGLGQGVMDNVPVLHVFRLIAERIGNAKHEQKEKQIPYGVLTLGALQASKSILYPLDKLVFAENEWPGVQESFGADRSSLPEDIEIVSLRELYKFPLSLKKNHPKETLPTNIGIIIHRKQVLKCEDNSCSNGKVSLKNLIDLETNLLGVHNTTLTFLKSFNEISNLEEFNMCPMDTLAFVVQYQH